MKSLFAWVCACAALTLCLAPSTAVQAATVTAQDVVHDSKSLGRPTTYTIILPPTVASTPVDSGTSYPVLYLLHGYSGNHRDWADKTRLSKLAAQRQWIIVLPDGNYDSWWVDSPIQTSSKMQSYLVKDLREEVESRWPARKDRAGRAIAGLSMGGHGALLAALEHPELYASASSLSGILDLRVHPKKWGIPKFLPVEPLEKILKYSVIGQMEDFRQLPGAKAPAILFDCGTSDTVAIEANRRLHEAMTNRGLYHQWNEYPGGHTWEYWDKHLEAHLNFHEKVRRGLDNQGPRVPTGPRPSERWRDAYTTKTLRYEAENREIWIPLANNPQAPETSRPIVLLGSSSFEIRDIRSTLPGYEVAYRGISADRLGLGERGLIHRLYCSAIDIKPRAVFILNGTNDLGSLSEPQGPKMEDLHGVYREVIQRILDGVPGVRVYAVSLSPLRDNYLRLVPKVEPFNNGVESLTRQLGNRVRYVDQWSALQDGQGVLKPEYSRDGLHLSPAGYEHLGKVMREALLQDGILPANSDGVPLAEDKPGN